MDSSSAPLAPNTKDNNEGREDSWSNQNDNKAPANREKKEYQPYHQKSSVPTWGQVKALGTQGEVIL